ncbi:hypothetical protein V8D89_005957 [Ganoderma adspersum]
MLYKLLRSHLVQQSDHFSALFSLKPLDPQEGMSDNNPIVLHGVTANKFDHICAFITGQFDNTVEGLAALLNLGTFLEMECPRNYALQQLNNQSSWSPFLKLYLGMRNQIPGWIEAAFRHIVLEIPLDNITMNNMLYVGGPAYWAIAIHSPTCRLTAGCGIAWKSEWWYTFAKCILHPDSKFTPSEALIEDECKAYTIQAVKEDRGLEQQEEIVQEALSALIRFLQQ